MLASDYEFWSEQVHVPAAAWLANGKRGAYLGSPIPVGAYESDKGPGGGDRKKQTNRDRRAGKRKRIAEEREELHKLKRDHVAIKVPGRKGKSKDQVGEPLGYSWAGKFGPCKDVAPGGKCACNVKRARKCCKCLSPAHQDADCPGSK